MTNPNKGGSAPAPPEAVDWNERGHDLVEKEFAESAERHIEGRRAALRDAGLSEGATLQGTLGLALSGGGIRSATISLGIIQSFARTKRLLDFDYCSTVSGGGYCGSFLGGLFLPDFARGVTPERSPRAGRKGDDPQIKAHFALKALSGDPQSSIETFPGSLSEDCDCHSTKVRNPVWWLREHSRYLAPNGPSDYLNAITNLVRSWLAMIYVFVLPIALLVLVLLLATWGMRLLPSDLRAIAVEWLYIPFVDPPACQVKTCKAAMPAFPISVMLVPTCIVLFVTAASGLAYWLTTYMSTAGRPWRERRNRWIWNAGWAFPAFSVSLLLGVAGLGWLTSRVATWLTAWLPSALPGYSHAATTTPGAMADVMDATSILFLAVMASVIVATLVNMVAHARALTVWTHTQSPDAYTAEVRRLITRFTGSAFMVLQVLLVLVIVDSLARWIYDSLLAGTLSFSSLFGATLAPAAAFLINKFSGWFGDGQSESRLARFIGSQVWTIALVVAIACYVLLAVTIHVGLQSIIFDGSDWAGYRIAFDPAKALRAAAWHHWPSAEVRWILCAVLLLCQLLVVGSASAFINMSSLHNLYAARLTRAYLGAGNLYRLRDNVLAGTRSRINESHAGDQITVDAYQCTFATHQNLAPMHLINVTLNETVSAQNSQLQDRDRKGVPLVFAPDGIFIDPARGLTDQNAYSWNKLRGVEVLSLGQLCAISGAAASTGMGSRTTLGGSLALTFANIRLGYWWSLNGLLTRRPDREPEAKRYGSFEMVESYMYLLYEMTARYKRTRPRVNISDGGHFENSGAYELLRRRVPTVLVCDNGADPKFHFEDLEHLIRKARIDLGIELTVAAPSTVNAVLARQGSGPALRPAKGRALFLNGGKADWRCRAAARSTECPAAVPEDSAFCLLLEARSCAGDWQGLVIWMKPRLFRGVEHDLAGYATAHPSFPNETTGDQFFDEAQWESYRKLGVTMAEALLSRTEHKQDLLRHLDAYSARSR